MVRDERSAVSHSSGEIRIEAHLEKGTPEMAVIVMSVGAPPELGEALSSLLRQKVPAELVVVNSGGGDVRARMPAGADGVKVISCDEVLWPGAARNLGIAESGAPYVAFLAADCIAEDGWIEGRLKRHRAGAAVVASAVVNNHPESPVAWASHAALFATRLPGIPPEKAARYGASYARELFGMYGLFENLRIGEDSEFRLRLGKAHLPAWAPEVRTIHRNPTSRLASWKDQFRRGIRSGKYWPQNHEEKIVPRVKTRFRFIMKLLKSSLQGDERAKALAGKRILALNLLIFELGATIGKRRCDPLQALEGKAQLAAKEKHWHEALGCWKQAERLQPGRRRSLCGIGAALLELGRLDEAAPIFLELRKDFPADPAGFRGGARVALERCDWEDALAFYDELWNRFGETEAIKKKVKLLLNLDRMPEAEAIAEALEKNADRNPEAFLHVIMPCLAQRHRWREMHELLVKHKDLVLENPDFLQRHVIVLNMLGRGYEAVDLINNSRAGKRSFRRILKLSVLIREHRNDEARVAFREIWTGSKLGDLPATLLAPMMAAAIDEGGPQFAQSILCRIREGAPATPSGNLLRVVSLFHGARLLGLRALESGVLPAPPDPPLELQVAAVLAESLPQQSGCDGAFDMHAACHLWQSWRTARTPFFPDPSFVLTDALELAGKILEAIDQRLPFSLIRLGDGEGNLLPYCPAYAHFADSDRSTTQRVWWGDHLPGEVENQALQASLAESIRQADVVGIPDLYRICRVLGTSKSFDTAGGAKNARGLLAILDFIGGLSGGQLLTSCHLHESLEYWGLWDLLLPRAGEISLITCHPELAQRLSNKHGVRIESVHLIPTEKKYSLVFNHGSGGRHYPEAFELLREKLAEIRPGQVFLVAAGMLGKIYCHWIRKAGGIGLDVGSAADAWCGFHTRGLDEASYYHGPPDLKQKLRALAERDPAFRRVFNPESPRTNEAGHGAGHELPGGREAMGNREEQTADRS
jgi:glycosyltransferase involved in cell wall biosynthesis